MATPPPPSRRLLDFALIAPFIGLFLLTPPMLSLFADTTSEALPILVVYLFFVWAGLIVLAAWLSRHLARVGDTDES